jgi:Domain of unknown function (DUF4291)
MPLVTESYTSQRARWPTTGRHILAQHDERSVVVYQAYAPRIGRFAAKHRWMMYRCGWAKKEDQETVLAVWLRREAFESVLAQAVHSNHVPEVYGSKEAWQEQVARSDVRLQWDPDHSPTGAPLERRAIQLGLQGETLRRYAKEWILDIEDITPFVHEQREHLTKARLEQLVTPRETVFWPSDEGTVKRLGLAAPPTS